MKRIFLTGTVLCLSASLFAQGRIELELEQQGSGNETYVLQKELSSTGLSTLTIGQYGKDNSVWVEQIGIGSMAEIFQYGTSNEITLKQYGGEEGIKAGLTQYGTENVMNVNVDVPEANIQVMQGMSEAEPGYRNRVEIDMTPDRSVLSSSQVNIIQAGEENEVYLSQPDFDGNNANIEQAGRNNIALAEQYFYGNHAELTQLGNDNYADIQQVGESTILSAIQEGNANNIRIQQAGFLLYMKLIQSGNENSMNIWQRGQSDGDIAATQLGDGNYIEVGQQATFSIGLNLEVNQLGNDNVVLAVQNGNENSALVNQIGDGHFATLYQTGNGNSLVIHQE